MEARRWAGSWRRFHLGIVMAWARCGIGLELLLRVAMAGEWRDPVSENLVTWHGMEAGLSAGGATCMVRDGDGYLWFGTFGGLARFDGLGFKVFNPLNTRRMSAYFVANAHRERSGTVWFSISGGALSYSDGAWRRHGREDGWTTDFARTFAEAPDGTLYVTGFDGKVLRRARGGRFEELPAPPPAKHGGFGACDRQGRLIVAKDGFVGSWSGHEWRALPDVAFGETPSEPLVAGPSRDGMLWVLKGGRLLKVDASGVVARFELDQAVGSPWEVYEDGSGDLWVTTSRDGVCHVQLPCVGDAPCESMARVTRIHEWGGRSFKSSRFVAEDRDGNVWMGTAADGLAQLRRKVVRTAGDPEGLGVGNVRSVTVDTRGRLWVAATDGGVFRCDSPGMGTRFRRMNYTNLMAPDAVLADKQGRVWATGAGAGHPVFQLDDDHARVVYRDGDAVGGRGPMFEDSMGRVWIAGPEDVVCRGTGGWQRYALAMVASLAEDAGWGGEGEGIFAFNPEGLWELKGSKFARVHDSSGAALTEIVCGLAARGGGLWLGGVDGGGKSLGWMARDRSVHWIGPAHGFPFEAITVVFEDASGWLWVGGDRGVARVSAAEVHSVMKGGRDRVHARVFGEGEGLPPNGHVFFSRHPNVAMTADGRLWFPTTRGLVWIWGSRVTSNKQAPVLLPGTASFIDTSGTSHEQEWRPDAELRFPAGSRSVRLGFTALNYSAPLRVMATTRLERSGRIIAERHGGDRNVTYELLPPGRYTWHVTAANEDGIRDDVGLRTAFTVEPFLWQTAWFRISMAAAGMAGVLGVAGYWVRHARLASKLAIAERDRVAALAIAEKAEALRRSEALRQKAEAEAEWRRQREAVVRDVHDGVGGIVANLHMTASLALCTADTSRQREQLTRMEAMAHEALVEVRGLMDAMEVDVTDFEGVAEEFRRYGHLVLDPHGIRLHVTAEGSARPHPVSATLCLGLFGIFKESLANVVKHSRASQVFIRLAASDEALILGIEDDGRGLPAEPRNGRGLHGMQRRAEELGGEMSMDSGPGLRLAFVIPWTRHEGTPSPEAAHPGLVLEERFQG